MLPLLRNSRAVAFFFSIIALSTQISYGSEDQNCKTKVQQQCVNYNSPYIIEGTIAYFYPLNHTVRQIYGKGGIEYGIEADFRIAQKKNTGFYAWASSSYFQKSGHTVAMDTETRLCLFSSGFGLKMFQSYQEVRFYLGLGALPSYLNIHDSSSYVKNVTRAWALGAIAQSGFTIRLYKWLWLKLFVDYTFVNFSPSHQSSNKVYFHNADLSHLSGGGGLSFQF